MYFIMHILPSAVMIGAFIQRCLGNITDLTFIIIYILTAIFVLFNDKC